MLVDVVDGPLLPVDKLSPKPGTEAALFVEEGVVPAESPAPASGSVDVLVEFVVLDVELPLFEVPLGLLVA
ncbi:MAG: hypothetical protein JWN70_2163 [Planctomycetaceae bacterium]|nr:hypothetical protein [Planctomycetaceae bacterium]